MIRIAVKHRKAKLSNFAIFHFFLTCLFFISALNEVAGCDAVMQKVGGWDFDSLSDSGCLFFEQSTVRNASSILPDASEMAKNRSKDIINRIGDRITGGIVKSCQTFRSRACFGDAIVDLHSLISKDVDPPFTTNDVYWQYYTDCDRWQVSFSNKAIISRRIEWMQEMNQLCRQTFFQLEFAAIENMPTGRLVISKNFSHPASPNAVVQQQSLSRWLSEFANRPLVCYWNSLNALQSGNSPSGIMGMIMNQLQDQLKTESVQRATADASSQ